MNQFAPDWSRNMGDAFAPLGGEDDGLMELLWCNGHVVMQSQAPPRKSPRPERAAAAVVQDDEAAAWFQYPVVEDPLERDLFSEFFGETAADAGTVCKQEEGYGVAAPQSGGLMMPPRPAHAPPREKAISGDTGTSEGAVANSAGGEGGAAAATEIGDSSALTVGSSFCGSNHVQTPRAGVPVDAAPPPRNGGKARDAATVTSSSSLRPMSSDTKTEAPGAGAHRSAGKRKQRDDDATQCDVTSQDAEFESAAVKCEPVQKPTTGKRRRAAEVHNLSERRRRDRINEKMKVLQELIPHCNKTDKASMLDEAIEYLKSLQLQLQMMWMGGAGMAAPAAPVMFPAGAHQYMQRLASMPMMPFMPAPLQSPAVGHQMPAADPYRRYPAADHLQPPSPMHYMQGMMSLYQQQQSPAPPPVAPGGSVPAATAPTPPSDGVLHKKYETCDKPDIRGMKS